MDAGNTRMMTMKTSDVLIHEPNVVRIWNGSLIDVSKIISISRPNLYRAYYGSMSNASVSVNIYTTDGKSPIVISEYPDNYSEYKLDADKMLLWKTVSGGWVYNPPDDEIAFYARFKRKVDVLIDYWTNHKEIIDLFPKND